MTKRELPSGSNDFSAAIRTRNRGCYDDPHSGVGMEFDPLELSTTSRRLVLHECGYLGGLDWWMFPNTLSPFWRFYYNSVPGHQVVLGGKGIELTPDRLVFIPDGNAFDSRGTTPVNHFWLTFSCRYAVKSPGAIILRANDEVIREIGSIAASFDGIGSGDRLAVYHRSLALLHRLVVEIRDHLRPEPRSDRVARAVAYLHQNFRSDVQVTEVAKAAGLSPRALSDHFQQEYHCSPMRYLIQLRVGEAAALLTRSDQDIEAIAQETGFADRFYLSRVFKRMTGHSPAEYRRAHIRKS